MKEKSLKDRLALWVKEFIHSHAAFDGRKSEEILEADIAESKTLFNKELPKRKAKESIESFQTKDGLNLSYWFVEKPSNTMLKVLIHGSGSNFAKADRAVYLLDQGFNVAMISYRGHSGNPGHADQKTIIRDVKETIENVMSLGYKQKDIYLEGSSLGTCSLVHALDRIYQKDNELFAGVLLKAAPLDLDTQDKYTLESLQKHKLSYSEAQDFIQRTWNQKEVYSRLKAKEILIVHGKDDDVVPVGHAQAIYDLLQVNNHNIELKLIDKEGHRLDLNQYGL